MKKLLLLAVTTFVCFGSAALALEPGKPIRALYLTGGCCHDYDHQKVIIPDAINANINVTWTIVQEGGTSTDHRMSIYENKDWAKDYDIIVHNECFADVADPEFIENVLAPHRAGKPAIVIHCEMHTFRALKSDAWHEFLGVTTTHHGAQYPLDIKVLQPDNPVMRGFPHDWSTMPEELYHIDKVWPTATALAQAPEKKKGPDGKWIDTPTLNTLIWINTYGQGRVFGTTLAHHNETMQNPAYGELLTRGFLWACDLLDDHGNPKTGFAPAKK